MEKIPSLESKEKKLITIEDIPTYMYGDRGGGYLFDEQVDDKAKPTVYWMHSLGTGDGHGDTRDLFDRDYMNKEYNSKAEIITKEQMVKKRNEQIGKKPIFRKDIFKESRKTIKEEKEKLYDVLHIYLKAEGPRDISTTTIGIKIPKDVNPAPFMEKLAKEVFEEDKNIGALFISRARLNEIGGWPEFDRRQSELKKFAQELFLKYANEQLANKNKK